jgi:hypothetical protein
MVQVVIQLLDDGRLNVNAPLENKVLVLGILEMAKAVVVAYQPSPIARPDGSDVIEVGKSKAN